MFLCATLAISAHRPIVGSSVTHRVLRPGTSRLCRSSADKSMEGAQAKAEPQPNPFALSEAWKRVKSSYAEGYQQARGAFQPERAAKLEAASTLRSVDLARSAALTCILVEIIAFGSALITVWLVSGSSVAAHGHAQARLFAALHIAVGLRAQTRMWRLLVEIAMLPWTAFALSRRPPELRATFFTDRATQALAVLATFLLTIRACNQGWLAGTSGPAAAVLWSRLIAMVRQVPGVSSLVLEQPLVHTFASEVTCAAQRTWTTVLAVSATVRSVDAWALALPPVAALRQLADLERLWAAPVRFVAMALHAAYLEVLIPGLKRLGWFTMQTLG